MTLKIGDLRHQHDAAEKMTAAILASIAGYRDQVDAAPIVGILRKLTVLLRVHFAFEDSALYPAVIEHGDTQASALAWQFHVEMGALAECFEDFARHWSSAIAIADNFDRFANEARVILAALVARIARENDQLYPLAETLALGPGRRAANA